MVNSHLQVYLDQNIEEVRREDGRDTELMPTDYKIHGEGLWRWQKGGRQTADVLSLRLPLPRFPSKIKNMFLGEDRNNNDKKKN